MEATSQPLSDASVVPDRAERRAKLLSTLIRWDIVLLTYIAVILIPRPDGIALRSWQLLAIFIATIIGLIAQPLPGGAMVLIGVLVIALVGVMPIKDALAGYADPVVWMVLAAFFMSRGMIKTGLGR